MVSTWATANHISLGQVAADAKSHEITAIPKLLEILEILGSMVTIDAMGCQIEIARRIAEAVRSHWGIENNLHWQVDVTFQEVQCRIRKGSRRRQLEFPPPHCAQPAQERVHTQGRNQE